MRRSWIIAVVIVLVLVAAGGTGAALVLPGLRAKPDPVARQFLDAWSRNDYAAMRALVSLPPDDFADQYQRMRSDLQITRARLQLGTVSTRGGTSATAPFTATLTLRGFGNWSYQGALQLSKPGRFGRDWRIDWSPAAIHPDLQQGERFRRERRWPERGSVLAGDGSVLAGPQGGASGPASLTSLVGSIGDITADDLKRLGAPYQGGDKAGRSGIERTFERRLAGAPTGEVQLVDEDGAQVKVLHRFGGKAGSSVRTSQPGDKVTCPKEVKLGGITIHNFEQEKLGSIPFNVAFAKSCNTAFVQLATQRLSGSELAQAASRFGFGVALAPGVSAATSRFPVPQSSPELAMAAFGQARVTASPLQMAGVAAAVQSGTWRGPKLVDDEALATLETRQPAARTLDPAVAGTLRDLMRQVVTSGTAAGAGLPDGVSGKTGTAEFGGGDKPPTHAWFIGFRNDLAVAVVVEGGGVGGEVAAPIAASFFKSVPS